MNLKPTGHLIFLISLLGIVSLSACNFSTSTSSSHPKADASPPITQISKHPAPGKFETRHQDGKSWLVSRFPVGRRGGAMTVSELGDGPKTFNPWASFEATSSSMGEALFSGLLQTDVYTGEVTPYLAESFTISPDQTEITVTMRDGLTWSDGHPLTVDDVVFTWNHILKAGLGNPSKRDIVLVDGKFPEVSKLDARRVRFKTARPFAPFLRMLGTSIAPKHVFELVIQHGGDRAFSAAYGVQDAIDHPESFVSSGMWLLDRYVPGERVIFKRNPQFFMIDAKGQQLPYLDFYAVRFVKDLNNAVLQFELGTLDTLGVPARFVNYLLNTPHQDFTLDDLGPTPGTTFVALNLSTRRSDDNKPMVDPIRSAWFRDTRFRQALDWAVDRRAMVENILLGAGVPLFLPETPASVFANPVLSKGHPQNLAKARALLKSAGFKWNKLGTLIDAKGHPVTFTIITNAGNDERESAGVAVQHDWAKLGIAVKLQPIDFNVLVGRMGNGQWEAVLLGLTGSPLEPHGGANVFMTTGGLHLYNQQDPKKPPVGLLPWEAEIDKAFMAGSASLEFKARQAAYWKFQETLYREQPMIYLFAPRQLVAIRKRLRNVDPTPLGVWHNLESVWVQK